MRKPKLFKLIKEKMKELILPFAEANCKRNIIIKEIKINQLKE